MRKWFCLFSLIEYLLISCNSIEIKKEYYPDGNLKSVTELVDSLKQGKKTEYFSNGVVKTISYFKNDTLDGEYFKYNSNGYIAERGHYRRGKRVGYLYRFYSKYNGKVAYEYYLLNAEGEEVPYYVKKFDLKGHLVDERKSITVDVKNDSVRLGELIEVRFEVFEKENYDSIVVIVGNFDEEFNPQKPLDTISLKNRKAEFSQVAYVKGDFFLRGKWIGYKKRVYTDSTVEYSTYGFFEEAIKVY